MKNVGIITVYGNKNFGNKLQNYALQLFLEKNFKNISVYTIKSTNKPVINMIKNCLKSFINHDKREQAFLKFNNNIRYDSKVINYNNPKFKRKYDYFIYGSDQVWNTNYEGKHKLFYGSFNSDAIFLSYSASFGTYSLSNEYVDDYKNNLSKFSYLSVREEQGKNILDKILPNKKITVDIDPTMLLSENEWSLVEKNPSIQPPKKYILNYFLGDISEVAKKEIDRVAKENNCEIINILDKNDPFYTCGPSEFLFLEKNAFLICTDSFHSSVFALLYDRPFIIFDRIEKGIESMGSRIDTLISKFHLKNRKFENNYISEKNLKHDYSDSYIILEKERQKTKDYFSKIFG